MYRLASVLIAFLVLAGCGLPGCGTTTTTHSSVSLPPIDHPYYGQATLRERILDAEVIARVRLRSVAPVGATTVGNYYISHIPALDFTFDVLEYLRGSGGDTIVARAYALENAEVPWGAPSDIQEAEQVARDEVLPFRDSRWDHREAVVFLRPPRKSGEPYLFGYIGQDPQTDSYSPSYGERITTTTLMYKLTVADDLYRVWLPDAAATTTARGTRGNTPGSKEQHFLLDDPAATSTATAVTGSVGATSPDAQPTTAARTISKSSLREKIAELDRLVATFDGDAAEIRACLSWREAGDRRRRVEAAAGIPQIQHIVTHRVGSGLPSGASIEWRLIDLPGEIERDWFGHGDARLFNVDKTNVTTVRPLPAGSYLTFYDAKLKGRVECDPNETTAKVWGFAVTVTAPEGTLAESFFDPYADGTAVTGTTTVGTISWQAASGGSGQAGRVTADLETDVTGQALDFIGLDGTTTVSLVVADATSTAGTLTWTVPTQPWSAGDKLMLRIRRSTAPQFSASTYAFTVAEKAAVGTAVGTVSAADPNDSPLAYAITSGNEAGDFAIGGSTGVITVASALSYESASSYALTVEATNAGGESATATVQVTVARANRAPVFATSTYAFTVSEAARAWSNVGTVSATDPDEGDSAWYYITAGNGAGRFNIDASSGELLVWGALDYESVSSYVLTVEARDGKEGGTATTTVTISITDVAEEPAPAPEDVSVSLSGGSFSVTWSVVPGADRYRVQHRAGSAGSWSSSEATTSASLVFTPAGGALCGTRHELRVQSHGDGVKYLSRWGGASEAVSHETGACVAPEFGSSTYSFLVSEAAAVGAAVGTVSAAGPGVGMVSHTISSGNGAGKFSIGSGDGLIAVAGALDYESVSSYALVVEASGLGGVATTSVSIVVEDVVETPPAAPRNLAATAGRTSVTLTWEAPGDPTVTGYRILRRRAPDQRDLLTHVEDTMSRSTTYEDSADIEAGARYVYRVIALNSAGAGTWSLPASATIPAQ